MAYVVPTNCAFGVLLGPADGALVEDEVEPGPRSTLVAEVFRGIPLSSPRFDFVGRFLCALSRKLITSGQLQTQGAETHSRVHTSVF